MKVAHTMIQNTAVAMAETPYETALLAAAVALVGFRCDGERDDDRKTVARHLNSAGRLAQTDAERQTVGNMWAMLAGTETPE